MGSRGWGHQLRKNRSMLRARMRQHRLEEALIKHMLQHWDAIRQQRPFWQSLMGHGST